MGSDTPSKLSVPQSRRQRNQPQRSNDIEFAADIAQTLILEVRKLQAMLQEREETIKVIKEEKSMLERHAAILEARIKTLDESEQKYKEDNWNLELLVQELQSQQTEITDVEGRLHGQIAALEMEKMYSLREIEDLKLAQARIEEEHQGALKLQENEVTGLRKTLATAEAEVGSLKRKVDELRQELDESRKASYRLRYIQQELAQQVEQEASQDEDDEDQPLEHSPPSSPSKPPPRHGPLEAETLRSSLQHAHRLIANLKSNVHREKTEKADLKRLLTEARDELEQARKESSAAPSVVKKRREPAGELKYKKPSRPNLLGATRKPTSEVTFMDNDIGGEEWEDAIPEPSTPSPMASFNLRPRLPARTDTTESFESNTESAFETARETDSAFETANDKESKDYPTSADETETEGTMGRRSHYSALGSYGKGSLRSINASKTSRGFNSGSSDDEDEKSGVPSTTYRTLSPGALDPREEFSPFQASSQRLKLRIKRGGPRTGPGNRIPSGSSVYRLTRGISADSIESSPSQSYPTTATQSPAASFRPRPSITLPSNAGQSLFAELGGSLAGTPGSFTNDETSDEDSHVSQLPSQRKDHTFGEPLRRMVDVGCNTEEPYPQIARPETPIDKMIAIDESYQLTPSSVRTHKQSSTQNTPVRYAATAEAGTQSTPIQRLHVSESATQSTPIPIVNFTSSGIQFTPVQAFDSGTQSSPITKAIVSDSSTQFTPSVNKQYIESSVQSDAITRPEMIAAGVQSEQLQKALSVSSGTQFEDLLGMSADSMPMITADVKYVSTAAQSENAPLVESGMQHAEIIHVVSSSTQSDTIGSEYMVSVGTQSETPQRPTMAEVGTQISKAKTLSSGTQFDDHIEKPRVITIAPVVMQAPAKRAMVDSGCQYDVEMEMPEGGTHAPVRMTPPPASPTRQTPPESSGMHSDTHTEVSTDTTVIPLSFSLDMIEPVTLAEISPVEHRLNLVNAVVVADIQPTQMQQDLPILLSDSPVTTVFSAEPSDEVTVESINKPHEGQVLSMAMTEVAVQEPVYAQEKIEFSDILAIDIAPVEPRTEAQSVPLLLASDAPFETSQSSYSVLSYHGTQRNIGSDTPHIAPVVLNSTNIDDQYQGPKSASVVYPKETEPNQNSPVFQPQPLSYSEILFTEVVPIAPDVEDTSSLITPFTLRRPSVVETSLRDEDLPNKHSNSLEVPRSRPTTSSSQNGDRPSFFGTLFRRSAKPDTIEDDVLSTPKGKSVEYRPLMVDQSVQTAISYELVKPVLVTTPLTSSTLHDPPQRYSSITHVASRESVASSNGSAGRPSSRGPDSAISYSKRPSSGHSNRSFVASYPPLPEDHREAIAAAQQRTTASLEAYSGMGPPNGSTSTSKNFGGLRPKTPNSVVVSSISDDSPTSKAATTPRPRVSVTSTNNRNELASPPHVPSHRSSMSSFASEIDDRFRINMTDEQISNHQLQNDPRIILAITQTMIGEYLWKYTRTATKGSLSQNRHRRFFWIHPYTRTLYWSEQDPSTAGKQELRAKSGMWHPLLNESEPELMFSPRKVSIEAVRVINDDNPHPPGLHRKSLVVITPGRTIKFTAPTGQRHDTWYMVGTSTVKLSTFYLTSLLGTLLSSY